MQIKTGNCVICKSQLGEIIELAYMQLTTVNNQINEIEILGYV